MKKYTYTQQRKFNRVYCVANSYPKLMAVKVKGERVTFDTQL